MEDEVIFDDDDFLDEEVIDTPPPQEEPVEDDLTTEVLRLKGIADPEKIKFEDETGAIVEKPWNSLSREEQINILTSQEEVQNDLSNDEIQFLNTIRSKGMSIQDYLNSLQPEPVETLEIDSLSDDDVYALDIIARVGADNVSDEEIDQLIVNAKQNTELYKKTVEGIRNEYKKLELDEKASQENEQLAKREADYQRFANTIFNEIGNLNSFAGSELELSKEDGEQLAAFMLDLDDQGLSSFGRALQDPALMTKAAFWLLNEQQIIEELGKQMQESYKRGFEAGKSVQKPDVVIKPKSSKTTEYFDDDDW